MFVLPLFDLRVQKIFKQKMKKKSLNNLNIVWRKLYNLNFVPYCLKFQYNGYRLILSFVVNYVWHGVDVGYLVCFLGFCLAVISGRKVWEVFNFPETKCEKKSYQNIFRSKIEHTAWKITLLKLLKVIFSNVNKNAFQ